MPFLPALAASTMTKLQTTATDTKPTPRHELSSTDAQTTSIRKLYPSSSFVRVGERWFRVSSHASDGVTVNTYDVETGKGMAIHCTCIDEVSDMARPRKTPEEKKTDKAAKVTDTLLASVQFCSPGYKEDGEAYTVHASIFGNWISTYNGVLMYGAPIETPLQAFPHFGKLLTALKATSGDGVQITQLSPERLSIKGRGLRTIVPCLADYAQVHRTPPDPPVSMIDSRITEGFEVLRQFINRNGEHIVNSTALLGNGYMLATDRQLLGMFWHGIGFPDNVVVPADFIEAVLKVPKSLVSFGYGTDTEGRGTSLTFYFADNSFIRTQLYKEQYPDTSKAMPSDWTGLSTIPEGFFDGLRRILPFVDKTKRRIYLNDGSYTTEDDAEEGTKVDIANAKYSKFAVDAERLLKLEGRITHIDLDAEQTRFLGENFRGVLCNFVPARDTAEPELDEKIDHQAPTLPGASIGAYTHDTPGPEDSGDPSDAYAPPQPVTDGDDGAPVDEPTFAPPAGFGPHQ